MPPTPEDAPGLNPFSPLSLITKAMGGTPVVKWALGVVGVVAAVSLALTLVSNPAAAAIGFLVMVFFMLLLRIVAQAVVSSRNTFKWPAFLIIWTVALSFFAACCLIFSSVVLKWPEPFPALIAEFRNQGSLPPVRPEKTPDSPKIVPPSPDNVREVIFGSGQEITPAQLPPTDQNSDSLTLDGATLTVGAVNANKRLSLGAKELKLINGGKIVTNGNVLHIEASSITSDGGQIVSFLPNNRRPPDSPDAGKAGAHGGEVQITTKKLIGRLDIDLSGQNGGLGGRGSDGTPGVNGTRGSNGVDGLFGCLHGGGDGGLGGNGSPGQQGAPGGDGGNGGTLILVGKAAHAISTNIVFTQRPGDGGSGGSGGVGGLAGRGGEGGSGSVYCGGGHGGPNGQPGPNGAPGASGSVGKPGFVKLP